MTAMAETGLLPPGFTRFGVPPQSEQRDYAPGEKAKFTKTISGIVLVTDKSQPEHFTIARKMLQNHGLPVTVIERSEMDERARKNDSDFKRQLASSFVVADTSNENSMPASVRQFALDVPIMPRQGRDADSIMSVVRSIKDRDRLTLETV